MAVAAGYLCDPERILCHAPGAITLLTRRRPTSQGQTLTGRGWGYKFATVVALRLWMLANQALGDVVLGRAKRPSSRNVNVSMARNSGTAK
jgi:hypothetical protein